MVSPDDIVAAKNRIRSLEEKIRTETDLGIDHGATLHQLNYFLKAAKNTLAGLEMLLTLQQPVNDHLSREN